MPGSPSGHGATLADRLIGDGETLSEPMSVAGTPDIHTLSPNDNDQMNNSQFVAHLSTSNHSGFGSASTRMTLPLSNTSSPGTSQPSSENDSSGYDSEGSDSDADVQIRKVEHM